MASPKPGTRGRQVSPPPVPPVLGFDAKLFMARTDALLGEGATDRERAALAGVSRTTLNRLRAEDIRLSLARAMAMCHTLDLDLHQLFPGQRRTKRRAA